ncbi:hypothetical protein C8R47DRAFT_1073283 [Mycena vitilis]|nr:hypothetical protein C8R47DRAFT_1073283 [Mycena vitilis]
MTCRGPGPGGGAGYSHDSADSLVPPPASSNLSQKGLYLLGTKAVNLRHRAIISSPGKSSTPSAPARSTSSAIAYPGPQDQALRKKSKFGVPEHIWGTGRGTETGKFGIGIWPPKMFRISAPSRAKTERVPETKPLQTARNSAFQVQFCRTKVPASLSKKKNEKRELLKRSLRAPRGVEPRLCLALQELVVRKSITEVAGFWVTMCGSGLETLARQRKSEEKVMIIMTTQYTAGNRTPSDHPG